ncbi:MAG: NAD(P)H-dependent oxidoreductase [Hyphomicrobiales bacterium]|nr:NAD(P)H-dependent oxidoreductase [Hyphomicrobiales bacterium]MCP4999354.1 NAD(P)H-dependent oxidoreductase [Hyphomicrobiales bacterium]
MTNTAGNPEGRVLVVSCHPLTDSLCKDLCDHVLLRFDERGADVVHLDLYATGFDPVLSAVERMHYHKKPYPTDALKRETDDLVSAETLVLVFPVWWFGFPAMLKGWFDRVWAPGVAYDHADNAGPIKPRLTKLRHCVAVATMGSPWWIDRIVMLRPVRRVLAHALVGACARQCRFRMLTLYRADSASGKNVDRFKRRIDIVLRLIQQ